MHFIEHLIEFKKLHLVWQAPNDPHRTRYVVGEILRKNDFENKFLENSEESVNPNFGVILRYLKDTEDFKKAVMLGFNEYPAFKIEKEIHSQGVLDSFMVRLPPRTRGDFKKYLEILRLPPNIEISDFALLGYSGAALPSDTFSIVPSFENVRGPCEFLMDVAGFRHIFQNNPNKIHEIKIGTEVFFEPEPDNPKDPQAIKIMMNNGKIGYITRAHLPTFHHWLKEGAQIKTVIERKNDHPETPAVYLFVAVKPVSG